MWKKHMNIWEQSPKTRMDWFVPLHWSWGSTWNTWGMPGDDWIAPWVLWLLLMSVRPMELWEEKKTNYGPGSISLFTVCELTKHPLPTESSANSYGPKTRSEKSYMKTNYPSLLPDRQWIQNFTLTLTLPLDKLKDEINATGDLSWPEVFPNWNSPRHPANGLARACWP